MKTDKDLNSLRAEFFEDSEIIFTLFDKDMNLIDGNKAFFELFRGKIENLLGRHITEFSPDLKSSGRYEQYLEVIRTGKSCVIDDLKVHPSLGNIYLRVRAFKVGEGIGMATKNITDFKESIEELETFIYKSSHDMRAPIASILGITEVALNDKNDVDSVLRYINIIKQQTQQLDHIIKNLVETARIRRQDKILQLIDFKEIITTVKKSLSFVNGFKDILFDENISVTQNFYSDKSLLTSLFQNLIDNAIKYKKENINDPFINITIVDKNGGINIAVADNGIGIADDLQKNIFKMFFRATNKASGSGLGLYTTKHCVKKLDGNISFDSKEKIGTTFTVYLPNENKVGQK